MLRAARRYAADSGVAFVRADAANLPIRHEAIDVVTAHSFLYLSGDRHAVLREAWRSLRPGGRIVLLEPADEARVRLPLLRRLPREPRFVTSMLLWRAYSRFRGRFSPVSLSAALTAGGFEQVGVEEALDGLALIAYGDKPAGG